MSDELATLTLKVRDRHFCLQERDLVQAEFESDDQFLERAKRLLERMRKDLA